MSSARPLILPLSSAVEPPSVDWQGVRTCLQALRAVQQEFEQFVGSLFDELDEAWSDLEANQARLADASQELAEKQADLAGLEENFTADRRQRDESLQQRVVELEKERLILLGELEAVRSHSDEFKLRLAEQQRRVAAERSDWQSELRLLRDVLERHARGSMGRVDLESSARTDSLLSDDELEAVVERSMTTPRDGKRGGKSSHANEPPLQRAAAPAATRGHSLAASDPVLGTVLSQIEMLQREVNRPRDGKGQRRDNHQR